MADAFSPEVQMNTDMTGVQEEIFSTTATTVGLDIHDANRKKIAIVIRPRCKEYVLKQRSIRTLSCFASPIPKSKSDSPHHDPCDTPIPDAETTLQDAKSAPSMTQKYLQSAAKKQLPSPAQKHLPPLAKKPLPIRPRAPPTKPRAMVVASGRIEKPRSPPRKIQRDAPDLPMDAPSVVAAQYELYSCGCSNPSQCRQCTLRRLADKFCAIVTARKEKLLREACGMYS
ncbi:hypothetical protein FB451DRAFT_1212575 [Mycena latifolia]|nr:hypothetical protein FB451DRAFT_1212575 [Mycena latifolia]